MTYSQLSLLHIREVADTEESRSTESTKQFS